MSPIRSQAAIRFVVALFLAQTFVNVVAVPHPHVHQVLDPRQVASLPVVARRETVEPDTKNVFDAIVDTLKGYNGWQVFQDFFRKLFNGPPPEKDGNGNYNVPPVVVVPLPSASDSPVDVISVIESIISEVASATQSIIVPVPTDAPVLSESDGIMSILPIWPITTAIDLSFTGEPSIPTELLSEILPEVTDSPISTDLPIIIVVPPIDANSTDVDIALPTEVLPPVGTAPIVTGPIVIIPVQTATPLFPTENGTVVAPLPGTDIPIIIVVPTDISEPVEVNATVSAVVSATADVGIDVNATISLTSTLDITVTIEPTLIGTGIETALPITLSESAPFINATVVPTLVLTTGTGDVIATIAPTLIVDPISAPYTNSTDATAFLPLGPSASVSGTGVISPSGTGVVSVEPIETIIGTGIDEVTAVLPIGTNLPLFPNVTEVETVIEATIVLPVGTGVSAIPLPSPIGEPVFPNATEVETVIEATIVLPIGTGVSAIPLPSPIDEPVFPNVTDIETIVAPTLILPTGTGISAIPLPSPIDEPVFPNVTDIETIVAPTLILPTGTGISAIPLPSPIDDPLFTNTTTTVFDIVTPSIDLGTGVVSATAPAGTIVVVPGPDVTFPNITITVNGSEATLPIALPTLVTEVPEITIDLSTLAPVVPVETEFPAIPVVTITDVPVETELPVIPIIPTDANVTVIPVETELPTDIALPIETELPTVPVETVDPEIEPIPSDAPVFEFPGLPALRTLCRDPTVRQLTLPVLNRFYGPSAYPSLNPFPGCQVPNFRQAVQAPGLLNCTSLGVEVQTCQASGRRVLLSVKADALGSVGGNADFGDPASAALPWGSYFANGTAPPGVFHPNLFDAQHVPSGLALTLFSLFGEGTTERADLRPLGPDTPAEDGISWVARPLGEEVVVDGFDVQVPRDWEGTYQAGQFDAFVARLRVLNDEAWVASGARRGGPNDLGVDGKGVVYRGWNRKRSVQRVVMVGGFEVLVE